MKRFCIVQTKMVANKACIIFMLSCLPMEQVFTHWEETKHLHQTYVQNHLGRKTILGFLPKVFSM